MEAPTTLPGEDPATPYIEDAVHWVSVYAELQALDRYLLERVGAAESSRGSIRNGQEGEYSQDVLRAMAARHAERQCFWRQRAEELSARGCRRQWASSASDRGR